MLLLMRQWAVFTGTNAYLHCPAELTAPGGDAYMVRTVEVEEPDGSIRREIEITREPSAYQVGDSKSRLLHLRNELAALLKTELSLREQAGAARADAAQKEAALTRKEEVAAKARALGNEIREIEPAAEAQAVETWRFPADLADVRLVVR